MRAAKAVDGMLSRRLQVRILPGAPDKAVKSVSMVGVAQLVEPRIVIPVVVGSSPIVHPSFYPAYRRYARLGFC